MPKLRRTDTELRLALSGAQDFPAALAAVKSISGRRFDPETKDWVFPVEPRIAERILVSVKPTADPAILAWVRASRAESEQELTTQLPDDCQSPLFIPWSDKLYDFQRALVEFGIAHPRMILADDMGLGKTVQALSVAAEYLIRNTDLTPGPSLVVCPASAKGVWAREIVKWLGPDSPHQIVDASTAKAREKQLRAGIKGGGWVIVNWEQVRAQKHVKEQEVHHRDGTVTMDELVTWSMKQPLFETTPWFAVVADEAHRAKSRKAAQTIGLWRIQAPVMIAATGTPLMNNPAELWSLLRWLYPEQYGNSLPKTAKRPAVPRTAYWSFHDQFTDSYEGYKNSKVVIGVKNPDGLRFELKDRLVRRTKAQKLNLPPKTREHVPLVMGRDQQKVYDQAETDFWLKIEQAIAEGDASARSFASDVLSGKKRIFEIVNGASRVVRLRQVLCTPALLGGLDKSVKMDAIVDGIIDNSHQQHVVFSEFVEGANILVARLRDKGVTAEAFTGQVSDTQIRTYYEDRFQQGKIDVLVGTIGAMRESITLHAANVVHFCERSWVPAYNEQAEDRLHRNGQIQPVTVLIYEVEGTVDTDKVRPTNDLKSLIVESVIVKDAVTER